MDKVKLKEIDVKITACRKLSKSELESIIEFRGVEAKITQKQFTCPHRMFCVTQGVGYLSQYCKGLCNKYFTYDEVTRTKSTEKVLRNNLRDKKAGHYNRYRKMRGKKKYSLWSKVFR